MSKKKIGMIEIAMRNRNISIIIAILLMAIGAVALMKMPRNEFPQFTIRQGVIVGVYPGATSAEVEEQLTKIVENYIFGYQEIKKEKTYSYSREGIMYIFAELNEDVKNADQFWSKLKHGLTELKMTLPSGVMALIANSDFGDTSALLITLSSDTKSYKEIEEQLKKLETECRKIPATSKIKHFGLQKEKIFVDINPEKLNEYNIKTISLLGSYQSNGMVSYAGELKDGKTVFPVHFPPNFESEKDLADQIVYSDINGNVVRLKDIATIERRYDTPESYIEQNGMKTILLSLEMQPGNNIVEFGADVDRALENFKKYCPTDIHVEKISELPKYVDDSITNFMHEFLIAIIAVILVTMILLPFRVASVAGVTVPIAVMITLGLLYFIGIELHTVSLAALIIVLGMIVDNSIVVIDNYIEKIDHGFSPWHSSIKSAKELITPIITATLAIVSAFFPLMIFLPGTSGEFVESLPIVVGVALFVSILVAVLIVPYLNFVFIKNGLKRKEGEKEKKSLLDFLQKWFDFLLEKAFKYARATITICIIILALSIYLFTKIDQQLFPEMERNQFAVEVYLPTGSSIEKTAEIIDSISYILLKDERVTTVTNFVGTSSPRFHTMYAPNMPTSNYGQLLINTSSDKATREIVNEYTPKYSNYFPSAHIKFKILAMGFSKAPIEIRITSDSIKDIRNTESKVYEILDKTKGLAWVRNDWDQKQQNIKIELDRDKANRLGYSKGFVATSLMVGLDGIPLTTIWENDYPVEVKLSQNEGTNKSINTIENQYITSLSSFSAMPLRSFAKLVPEWTEGTITHRNGTRTLTISVDNDLDIMASNIFNEISPLIDAIELPNGTSINYGGDHEGQIEVFVPMGIALGVTVVLIFFILLFQFKKEKLALLILSTMLLALPGAALGLFITGYAFSLTAFIGITSLCGMVVRNGIILIDYARELRENNKKMTVLEAAMAAGKRRMRPIFLTSAAASVGVIPMIMSGSMLWGPLGTVICFGLIISMVLTLFVLPILYSWIFSDKVSKKGFWSLPSKRVVASTVVVLLFLVPKAQSQTLTLDSCKALAINNNYKIKEATNEVRQANEVKKSAFTSFFPSASAMATAVRFNDYMIEGNIPEMNLPVYDGNTANLQDPTLFAYFPGMELGLVDYLNTANLMITQPVYTGGRIRNGNKLANIGYEISKEKQNMTKTDVLIKTEELYWTNISLTGKLNTLDSYVKLLENLYQNVKVSYDAGLVQRSDLLKIQLKLNELQVSRLKLANGIDLSKRALCQHIGIQFDNLLTIASEMEIKEKLKFNSNNPEQLATNRGEYRMLEKAVDVQKLQTKMLKGECLPQIAVGGAGVYADIMDNSMIHGLVFATVSVPISDWWSGSHKIKESKIKIENAQYRLEETTEMLAIQIQQAMNAVNEDYFQIEIAKKSIEQAQENLKVVTDNYNAGIVNMSELLEAQSDYQNALNNLIDAQCNYKIKVAKYLQATNNYN